MTIGVAYGSVNNGALGNPKVSSSFGLPGAGTTAAYMRCDFNVKITVEDDLSTYCAIQGGEVVQDDIRGSEFPSFLWCFGHAWDVTISNGNAWEWMNKSECFHTFTQTKGTEANSRLQHSFITDSGRGGYIGKLNNFSWVSETEGIGYVWVGGSAIYDPSSITNPIWVWGSQIAVPGLRELLNYYPWAIKKGAGYNSCNRSGGSLKMRKSGNWRDCKNTKSSDLSKSTVFARKAGSWSPCPKL